MTKNISFFDNFSKFRGEMYLSAGHILRTAVRAYLKLKILSTCQQLIIELTASNVLGITFSFDRVIILFHRPVPKPF